MISSTADCKLDFTKEPKDSQIISKFGNMTHPEVEYLCMQTVVPRKNQQDPENMFKVKFQKINTNQLSQITRAYRSGLDHQTILITKEIRNF